MRQIFAIIVALSLVLGGQAWAARSELSLMAGSQKNSHDSGFFGQLEYRLRQSEPEWLGGSIALIQEGGMEEPPKPGKRGDSVKHDRDGVAGQIWLGLSPANAWHVSIGAGPYFYSGQPKSGSAVIGSLDLAFDLAPLIFRLRLNTINGSENNAQSLVFGAGFSFGN